MSVQTLGSAILVAAMLATMNVKADEPAEKRTACETSHQLRIDSRQYSACGELLVIRVKGDANEYVELERRLAPTPIVGLFERNGEVFVELHEVVLRPASSLALAQPRLSGVNGKSTLVSVPPILDERTTGEVVSVETRSFLVSLGTQDGLSEGDRVAVLTYADEEVAGERIRTEKILLVAEVYEVAPEHARARLGVGESVQLGAPVRVTNKPPTAKLINRPRYSGLSFGVSLQPFLPINDDLAFATLGDAHLTYRFDAPAYVRAVVGAFGGLASGQGNQSVFDGWVDAGFDHKVFSLGLGVGALRTETSQGSMVDSSFQPTLVQTARFGPLDGLNLSLSTRALVRDKEVRFGAATASLWIPVQRRVTLVLNGGGGSPALYGFGTVGARFLVRGNGGHKSLFITPAVGYATIKRFDQQGNFASEDSVGGPSLSVGVEWRP